MGVAPKEPELSGGVGHRVRVSVRASCGPNTSCAEKKIRPESKAFLVEPVMLPILDFGKIGTTSKIEAESALRGGVISIISGS